VTFQHHDSNLPITFQTEIAYYYNSTSGYSSLKAEETNIYNLSTKKIVDAH
jgi:hypothetical protein